MSIKVYNLDVEEFEGSKSASKVEFEGIKSGEEEMEAARSRALPNQKGFQGLCSNTT